MVLKSRDKEQVLADLEGFLRAELLKEFTAQGHTMTGAVVKSAEFVARTVANKLEFLLYMYPYAGYLESGTAAAKIPFSGATGRGGTSLYIQALIRYAEKRMGLTGKEAKSAAFAIAHTQKKYGMPTPRSYQYSKTGSRTHWVTTTMWRNADQIRAAMYEYVDAVLGVVFENLITKYKLEFNT